MGAWRKGELVEVRLEQQVPPEEGGEWKDTGQSVKGTLASGRDSVTEDGGTWYVLPPDALKEDADRDPQKVGYFGMRAAIAFTGDPFDPFEGKGMFGDKEPSPLAGEMICRFVVEHTEQQQPIPAAA
jgi:hypothetical protein